MNQPDNAPAPTFWHGNRKLADEVAPALDTIGIHCVAIVGERVPNSSVEGNLSFTLSAKDTHWSKETTSGLVAVFPFEIAVTATPEGGKEEGLAHFFLQYLLAYKMNKPLDSWADLAIESFVAFYGSTHAWPYLRADVQSLSVKIGIPTLTLPILRAGQLPAGFTIAQNPETDDAPLLPASSEASR